MPPVLVVDDEPDFVQLLSFNLLQAGFAVESAANGVEAVTKARQILPIAIVLDLMMPEMDGIEVCRHLKRDPRTKAIPILLMTALNSKFARTASLESGAKVFLAKPFSPFELVAQMRKLVAASS